MYHITEKLKCIWFLALTLWLHLITAFILSSTPTAICGAPLHTLSLTLGGPVSLNANYTQFSCRVLLVCRHCRHAIAATLNCINKQLPQKRVGIKAVRHIVHYIQKSLSCFLQLRKIPNILIINKRAMCTIKILLLW